jgi:hypothetical protein
MSLSELEVFVSKIESLCDRYDISEAVYRDILAKQEELFQYLHQNPDCYSSQELRAKALTTNRYVVFILMTKVSEILESKI